MFRSYDFERDLCNCKAFLLHKYCKHSIASKIDNKQLKIPQISALEGLFKGNLVGRPRRVGNALSHE
jgi:hypothetical protein